MQNMARLSASDQHLCLAAGDAVMASERPGGEAFIFGVSPKMKLTKVYLDLLHDASVSYAARIHYCVLLRYNQSGKCYPSVHTQAKRQHISPRRIIDYNNELADANWLVRQRRQQTSNTYQLLRCPAEEEYIPLFDFPIYKYADGGRATITLRQKLIYGELWRMQFGWSRRKEEDFPTTTIKRLMLKTRITHRDVVYKALRMFRASKLIRHDMPEHVKDSFAFCLYEPYGAMVHDPDIDECSLPEWDDEYAENHAVH
jgi:hypothetical protein